MNASKRERGLSHCGRPGRSLIDRYVTLVKSPKELTQYIPQITNLTYVTSFISLVKLRCVYLCEVVKFKTKKGPNLRCVERSFNDVPSRLFLCSTAPLFTHKPDTRVSLYGSGVRENWGERHTSH